MSLYTLQTNPFYQPSVDTDSSLSAEREFGSPEHNDFSATSDGNADSVASNDDTKTLGSQKAPLILEHLTTPDTIKTDTNELHPLRQYSTNITPNDPNSSQWWETSLKLPQAWDNGTGSASTVLAIIDTGFALDHEEFAGRWHENTGESGHTTQEQPSRLNCSDRSQSLNQSCNLIDDNFDGIVDNEFGATTTENDSQLNCSDQARSLDKSCNLIDDDSNGFIDDWRGWDFINYDRSVAPGETDPSGRGTRHGTYVASVAAGNGNNGVGIAGVDWNTRILPVQALNDSGSGNSLSVARAIRYAVAQGADVISLSLGGPYPDTFLRQTITEAIANGVIVVAAAGNDGCDCISYPANYDEVLAVGALTHSGTRASFSSYGPHLDIMAPGVGLYTASWSHTNQTNLYASGISGTSLATPLVSGLLTLIKSHLPHTSNQQLVATLLENTNRLSLSPTQERSNTLGFGAIDALAASNRALGITNRNYAIGFSDISHGTHLYSSALEDQGSQLYACDGGDFGSSAIYRLEKTGDVFYSSSQSEAVRAQENGYTKTLLGYFCAQLPNDTKTEERTINLHNEFNNQLPKNSN